MAINEPLQLFLLFSILLWDIATKSNMWDFCSVLLSLSLCVLCLIKGHSRCIMHIALSFSFVGYLHHLLRLFIFTSFFFFRRLNFLRVCVCLASERFCHYGSMRHSFIRKPNLLNSKLKIESRCKHAKSTRVVIFPNIFHIL